MTQYQFIPNCNVKADRIYSITNMIGDSHSDGYFGHLELILYTLEEILKIIKMLIR